MDETYRMMGRGREADFEREAASRRLAAEARRAGADAKRSQGSEAPGTSRLSIGARLAALLGVPARENPA
jgi:hypothetical protein